MAYMDGETDFEDGLIRAIAELEDVNYIITRDSCAYATSRVPCASAAEYLEIAEKEDSLFIPW